MTSMYLCEGMEYISDTMTGGSDYLIALDQQNCDGYRNGLQYFLENTEVNMAGVPTAGKRASKSLVAYIQRGK